jgi:hypothetical protein
MRSAPPDLASNAQFSGLSVWSRRAPPARDNRSSWPLQRARPSVVTFDRLRCRVRRFSTAPSGSNLLAEYIQRLAERLLLLPFGMQVAVSDSSIEMFKISTIDTRFQRKLVVEGKLVEPGNTWYDAGEGLQGRRLVIDLANVTVISQEGENAITDLMNQGARFSCDGILTRHVLRRLSRRWRTKCQDWRKTT